MNAHELTLRPKPCHRKIKVLPHTDCAALPPIIRNGSARAECAPHYVANGSASSRRLISCCVHRCRAWPSRMTTRRRAAVSSISMAAKSPTTTKWPGPASPHSTGCPRRQCQTVEARAAYRSACKLLAGILKIAVRLPLPGSWNASSEVLRHRHSKAPFDRLPCRLDRSPFGTKPTHPSTPVTQYGRDLVLLSHNTQHSVFM